MSTAVNPAYRSMSHGRNSCRDGSKWIRGKVVWVCKTGGSAHCKDMTTGEVYYFQSSDTSINIKLLVLGDLVRFKEVAVAHEWSPKDLKVALDVRLDS